MPVASTSVVGAPDRLELGRAARPGLLTPSVGYKPFRYPWAYDLWRRQQQVHWMAAEVPLGEDCKDWARLSDGERALLTQVFRFFTQADVDVSDNYMERLAGVFRPTEVRMMLSAFAAMETVHIDAYSLLVDTVGLDEGEYSAFMAIAEMRDKHRFSASFSARNPFDTLVTLATFGGFIEGLQLFASFAVLASFPRRGLMRGMGQVVSWSVRDETLHCEGVCRLYRELRDELLGGRDAGLTEAVARAAQEAVALEYDFMDSIFELAEDEDIGLTELEVRLYVRWVAAHRFRQLDEPVPAWLAGLVDTPHPLPWLPEVLEAVEHANFFETRATEYSKATASGDWDQTFDMFDRSMGRTPEDG